MTRPASIILDPEARPYVAPTQKIARAIVKAKKRYAVPKRKSPGPASEETKAKLRAIWAERRAKKNEADKS